MYKCDSICEASNTACLQSVQVLFHRSMHNVLVIPRGQNVRAALAKDVQIVAREVSGVAFRLELNGCLRLVILTK
jgi:hypothetical protein